MEDKSEKNLDRGLHPLFLMDYCTAFDKIAWMYGPFSKVCGKPGEYYKKIYSIAETKASDTVLDVGGGTGTIANYFSHGVKSITVLDPSKKMLAKIQSEKIGKVAGAAQQIPFNDNAFDLVYCVDSFHHFTNGYKKQGWREITDVCIRELLRVLKRDGTLVVIEHDTGKFRGGFMRFFENTIMRWGSSFYLPGEFEELFKKYRVDVNIFDLDTRCYVAKVTKK